LFFNFKCQRSVRDSKKEYYSCQKRHVVNKKRDRAKGMKKIPKTAFHTIETSGIIQGEQRADFFQTYCTINGDICVYWKRLMRC